MESRDITIADIIKVAMGNTEFAPYRIWGLFGYDPAKLKEYERQRHIGNELIAQLRIFLPAFNEAYKAMMKTQEHLKTVSDDTGRGIKAPEGNKPIPEEILKHYPDAKWANGSQQKIIALMSPPIDWPCDKCGGLMEEYKYWYGDGWYCHYCADDAGLPEKD